MAMGNRLLRVFFASYLTMRSKTKEYSNSMNAHFPIFLKARNKFLFVTLSLYTVDISPLSILDFPHKNPPSKIVKICCLFLLLSLLSWGLSFTALLKVVEERYTTLLFFSRKKKTPKKNGSEIVVHSLKSPKNFLDIFCWAFERGAIRQVATGFQGLLSDPLFLFSPSIFTISLISSGFYDAEEEEEKERIVWKQWNEILLFRQ